MFSRHHLLSTTFLRPPPIIHTALFHASSTWRSEAANYYETLGLAPSASTEAIKKYIAHSIPFFVPCSLSARQFYQLSKTHHPDHNPNDPGASDRFVKISEAYGVLGSAPKRERYDRDLQRSQSASSHNHHRGSHSSSSSSFGSRPASGLSRRRSQFSGPPPSFYRSGGWGQQASKRQSQAGASGTGEARGEGYGPGQEQAGFGNDVPHFDRHGHSRTQEQQDHRRRRRLQQERVEHSEGGSTFVKFALTAAVVTFAFSVPSWFDSTTDRRRRKDKSS